MAMWEQLNFQNSNSPAMEQLIFLHDHIMSILCLIMTIVFYIMMIFFLEKKNMTKSKESHSLEIIWTFLPGLVLILIAFPSLRLLYMTEESKDYSVSLKTMGHQWYWSYEYTNFKEIEFDSFMLPTENIKVLRLLETDNNIMLPIKMYTQLFTSSTDVLHSWTIPSMGVKMDSTPGRLNISNMYPNSMGTFYGQCSEICGANHSFMPITLNISSLNMFKNWLKQN